MSGTIDTMRRSGTGEARAAASAPRIRYNRHAWHRHGTAIRLAKDLTVSSPRPLVPAVANVRDARASGKPSPRMAGGTATTDGQTDRAKNSDAAIGLR